ncbi:putative membrane associated lipid hydrolase, neutral ceramidase superfamily [Halanaeroarchaeum sp. HSR-CO]|uniref:DUF2070 family protein n=1 Tax=Halanaeroarchaeum sp. HSR-CO TaxID=2866382 RepID=UPI00217CD609|nr:DUF2070 family protein [Halanaeroarchaeum sp. HSR-CO]UWG47192.1 putative membrane associated lipid hydrolase, neutral ceramidase superfamily [Halanaeroarchaeum sp. HSR-CO]
MTETQGELAALSKYIFRAPSWRATVPFSLLIAALAGVAAFDSRFLLEDIWQGIFFIGAPTLVSAAATTPIDRWLGGQLTFTRSSLLATVGEVVLVALVSLAGIVTVFTDLGQNFVFDVLIAALALVFAIRLLVVLAVSRTSPLLASIPASIQTLTSGLVLFVYSGTMNYFSIGGPYLQAILSRTEDAPSEITQAFIPSDFGLLVAMSVLYGVVAYGFVLAIDRPWQRSLGVSSLDFIQGFIGHVAEGSRELETFFEQIGERSIVPVTVLSFRREKGDEKARFVLPMIHPGPMGEIGGGNLPQRVAESTAGLAFPPHATAGHDFNLVTEREVGTLIDAAESALETIDYHGEATPAIRSVEGEAKILGQRFGEDGLLVSTFAPTFTDDVDYSVGLTTMAEARVAGLEDVLLVDAHNCNNGLEGDDLGHVVPGSGRSFEMMQAASAAADRLVEADTEPMGLGTAWDRTTWRIEDGIGPLGVRVAVLEVGEQRTGYVLIDGNNMEPGLRDRLLEAVDDLDAMEVMTTDTHVVNTVESTNQVGDAIEEAALVDLVESLVAEALEDVEPVEAGMATERAEVTVFGNDRTETLASQANAVISMAGWLGAAVIVATGAISLLVFLVT